MYFRLFWRRSSARLTCALFLPIILLIIRKFNSSRKRRTCWMNRVLVIENIPPDKGSPEITELLSPLGMVNWVYVQDKVTGKRARRTAYVEMSREQEAARVIVKWNGAQWERRVLRIKYIDANFDPQTAISDLPKPK